MSNNISHNHKCPRCKRNLWKTGRRSETRYRCTDCKSRFKLEDGKLVPTLPAGHNKRKQNNRCPGCSSLLVIHRTNTYRCRVCNRAIVEYCGVLSFKDEIKTDPITYFIGSNWHANVKIGRTSAHLLTERLLMLRTGDPTLHLLKTLDGDHEKVMHHKFNDLNVGGEFFRCEGELFDMLRDRL